MSNEEKVLYIAKIHRSAYIIPSLLVILYGLWILFIIYQKKRKIQLTNKSFVYSYGLLSKTELSIRIEKIESVRIEKWLLDMVFWWWSIVVSGTGWNYEPIRNIDNPEALKEAIESIIHN
jgi:uncharacterized membrane protein YdbT with pleckstrin-like domain